MVDARNYSCSQQGNRDPYPNQKNKKVLKISTGVPQIQNLNIDHQSKIQEIII